MCNPTDPMNDGQPCGTGCPMGQTCVNSNSGPVCRLDCDPNAQASCPCDRSCYGLTTPDGGVAGGACFPGNPAGERCNSNFGTGDCAQGRFCINSGGSMNAYCAYDCKMNTDCPAQMFCAMINNSMGQLVGTACAYTYNSMGKAAGAACAATDSCVTGYLCDGTCKPQCDGPGGTCAAGTCTALTDGAKTIGYVCK
jgi:hypothetical protein